jgi:hypothetical protein
MLGIRSQNGRVQTASSNMKIKPMFSDTENDAMYKYRINNDVRKHMTRL